MTFRSSSINSTTHTHPPPPHTHLSLSLSLSMFFSFSLSNTHCPLFLFLAVYLSNRHVRNDLLIANIITAFCLHVSECVCAVQVQVCVCVCVCVCVHIWARAHVILSVFTCVSMCSRTHITDRCFKYSFYPDVLLVRVSAYVCVRVRYRDNRPFVA